LKRLFRKLTEQARRRKKQGDPWNYYWWAPRLWIDQSPALLSLPWCWFHSYPARRQRKLDLGQSAININLYRNNIRIHIPVKQDRRSPSAEEAPCLQGWWFSLCLKTW
jgi:hypothetical protein